MQNIPSLISNSEIQYTPVVRSSIEGPLEACIICTDAFTADSVIARMHCCGAQVFHSECLEKNVFAAGDKNCPLCKKEITTLVTGRRADQSVADAASEALDMLSKEVEDRMKFEMRQLIAGHQEMPMVKFVYELFRKMEGRDDVEKQLVLLKIMEKCQRLFPPSRRNRLGSDIEGALSLVRAGVRPQEVAQQASRPSRQAARPHGDLTEDELIQLAMQASIGDVRPRDSDLERAIQASLLDHKGMADGLMMTPTVIQFGDEAESRPENKDRKREGKNKSKAAAPAAVAAPRAAAPIVAAPVVVPAVRARPARCHSRLQRALVATMVLVMGLTVRYLANRYAP